jgi:hypothetical protein
MGTQIIEARNKVHKVEAQNKKTRKVGANNSAIKKKTLKGEQTIHRVKQSDQKQRSMSPISGETADFVMVPQIL